MITNDPSHRPISIKEVDINPLIARGAFGRVDIALLIHWASTDRPPPSNSNSPATATSTRPVEARSVSLAAIKTIPNATIPSSSSGRNGGAASLTREAFAELNALRLLNGHENVTPLLGFYGARDSVASGSGSGGGGFGGWDWATDDSRAGRDEDAIPSSPSSLCLAFPYHPVDLADALNHRRLKSFANGTPHRSFHLPPDVVRSIVHDVLSALKHVHAHCILHRDVKPGNLYITNDGRIQLGDFGLAKAVPGPVSDETKERTPTNEGHCENDTTRESNPSVTQGLCTLQYRPPELLLGGTGIIDESHDKTDGVNGALDIWSAGCIFAEILTLSGPLFPGRSELDQLGRIFRVLGTPTREAWPGVIALPDWDKVRFEPLTVTGLREKLSGEGDCSWHRSLGELIGEMLSLDPCGRPSARKCLNHSWLHPFGEGGERDEAQKRRARQNVVNELIPSFLRITSPIFFSPRTRTAIVNGNADSIIGDGNDPSDIHCDNRIKDRFKFATYYASKLASSRRSFPRSSPADIDPEADKVVKRWKCSTKANGLLRACFRGNME